MAALDHEEATTPVRSLHQPSFAMRELTQRPSYYFDVVRQKQKEPQGYRVFRGGLDGQNIAGS